MSSEMTYSDDDLRVIVQDWSESDPDQAVAINLARECLHHRAILTRTEAGADGAVACHRIVRCGIPYDIAIKQAKWITGQMSLDEVAEWELHGYRVEYAYTNPQDASGDAVSGRVNGYMFSARAIEIITDGDVPEWITKAPGLRVTIAAMQAKEAK